MALKESQLEFYKGSYHTKVQILQLIELLITRNFKDIQHKDIWTFKRANR